MWTWTICTISINEPSSRIIYEWIALLLVDQQQTISNLHPHYTRLNIRSSLSLHITHIHIATFESSPDTFSRCSSRSLSPPCWHSLPLLQMDVSTARTTPGLRRIALPQRPARPSTLRTTRRFQPTTRRRRQRRCTSRIPLQSTLTSKSSSIDPFRYFSLLRVLVKKKNNSLTCHYFCSPQNPNQNLPSPHHIHRHHNSHLRNRNPHQNPHCQNSHDHVPDHLLERLQSPHHPHLRATLHLCLQCTTIVHDNRERQSQSDCHKEIGNVCRYQEVSNYNEVARYRYFDCVFCQGGLSHHDYDDRYDGFAYDYAGTSGAWILLSVKFLFFLLGVYDKRYGNEGGI